jgi:hypothetical protein
MLLAQSGEAKVMPKNPFAGVTTVVRQARTAANAADVAPIIAKLQASGVTSLPGIAKALNERGISTAAGGRWYHPQVRRLLARFQG